MPNGRVIPDDGRTWQYDKDPINRLAAIPGIDVFAAQQIIAEAGTDGSAFDSTAQSSPAFRVTNDMTLRGAVARCYSLRYV